MADINDEETVGGFLGRGDVLCGRHCSRLTPANTNPFVQSVDEPPAPNEKLQRLLASRSPWQT